MSTTAHYFTWRLENSRSARAKSGQRVFTREQRGDTTHAAEVALYYLYLAAEPQQALQWTNINWQQAKSFNDQQLLSKIRRLAGTAADG